LIVVEPEALIVQLVLDGAAIALVPQVDGLGRDADKVRERLDLRDLTIG
jgi:hypothetical protein